MVNKFGETSSDAGMGAWKHGEIYGHNMINNFNNYNEGWIDWNLVLDEKGGPNYAGNFCEAPILVDTRNNKLIYNVSYYYIGHFSRFIKPGAKRILCMNDSDKGDRKLQALNDYANRRYEDIQNSIFNNGGDSYC